MSQDQKIQIPTSINKVFFVLTIEGDQLTINKAIRTLRKKYINGTLVEQIVIP